QHADEPYVAPERDPLDAVLGLATPARPQRRPEPDHVLGDPNVEQLGRKQVADLVQGDGDQQPDEEDHEPGHEEPAHERVPPGRTRWYAERRTLRASPTALRVIRGRNRRAGRTARRPPRATPGPGGLPGSARSRLPRRWTPDERPGYGRQMSTMAQSSFCPADMVCTSWRARSLKPEANCRSASPSSRSSPLSMSRPGCSTRPSVKSMSASPLRSVPESLSQCSSGTTPSTTPLAVETRQTPEPESKRTAGGWPAEVITYSPVRRLSLRWTAVTKPSSPSWRCR